MTGILSAKVEFYLECDADEEEAKKAMSDFAEQVEEMNVAGVFVQTVKVEDTTTHQ